MRKTSFVLLVSLLQAAIGVAQYNKSTTYYNQVWLSYSNTLRLSKKFGVLADLQLRTRDRFVKGVSMSMNSIGMSYYTSENTRATLGYTHVLNYADGARVVTVPEHRPFQQWQWSTRYSQKRMLQWIRLEERYRRKLASNTELAKGYNYNMRVRYNILFDLPLSKKGIAPKTFSLVVNDELNINIGKQIVLNTFDQNRFFCGLKYQWSAANNIQVGYINLYQQLSAGNKYRKVDAARIAWLQNFDLRKLHTSKATEPVAPQ